MASCYLTGMAVCPPSSLECCVVLQQCGEGILCLDAKGRVNYANLRACEVLGATADMLVGKVLFDDSHPQEDGRPSLLPLFRGESGEMLPLSPGMHQARVSSATHGDLPVNCRIAVVTLADGDLGYVVSFHDTRDQIATEERLTYLAHHDPLTDLPNRRLVSERLDYEISRARRYDGGRSARSEAAEDKPRRTTSSRTDSVGDAFAKSFARQLGTKSGQALVRGVLGSLFRGK